MEENEFKKLSANSRDWLIYELLSDRSKETVLEDLVGEKELSAHEGSHQTESSAVESVKIPTSCRTGNDSKSAEPKGETTVQETVTGKVVLVTDLAVLIGNADRVAWFPKSVIKNLDKIALKQGKMVELKIVDWFKYKIEWKVPTI